MQKSFQSCAQRAAMTTKSTNTASDLVHLLSQLWLLKMAETGWQTQASLHRLSLRHSPSHHPCRNMHQQRYACSQFYKKFALVHLPCIIKTREYNGKENASASMPIYMHRWADRMNTQCHQCPFYGLVEDNDSVKDLMLRAARLKTRRNIQLFIACSCLKDVWECSSSGYMYEIISFHAKIIQCVYITEASQSECRFYKAIIANYNGDTS